MNAYGVWKWTSRPEPPPAREPAAKPERPVERVLRLRNVEQVDVSPDRELTLRLTFNEEPDRSQITRFFRLSAPGQDQVEYWMLGTTGSGAVWVETQPVLAERLDYALDPGLPAASGDVMPEDKPRQGSLELQHNLQLRDLEASSPSFEAPELWAEFNAFPEPNGLKEYIAVEPEVSFTAEVVKRWWETGLQLKGDFKPGQIYEVTFKAGFPPPTVRACPRPSPAPCSFPCPSRPCGWIRPGGICRRRASCRCRCWR